MKNVHHAHGVEILSILNIITLKCKSVCKNKCAAFFFLSLKEKIEVI